MTDPKKNNDPEVASICRDDYIQRSRKGNRSESVKDRNPSKNDLLAFSTNNNARQTTSEKVSSLSTFLLSTKLLEENLLGTRIEFQRNAYDDIDELWLVTWKYNITDEQMRVRLMKDELEKFIYPIYLTLKHFKIHKYEECIEIRLGFEHPIFP